MSDPRDEKRARETASVVYEGVRERFLSKQGAGGEAVNTIDEARVEYDRARVALRNARVEYDRARVARDEAWRAYDEAWWVLDKAKWAYDRAGRVLDEAAQGHTEAPISSVKVAREAADQILELERANVPPPVDFAAKIILRALEDARREQQEEALNHAAMVAQGITHGPCEEALPCVRCERDRLLAEWRPKERQAFVSGAAWWEHEKEGATIWTSDRRKADEEAARRYGPWEGK